MDKEFLIYITVGVIFGYLIITNVDDLQREDERYQNSAYHEKHKYEQYYEVDSVGDIIINVLDAPVNKQHDIWNNSLIKQDFLDLFPDFELMEEFINNRVVGEPLKKDLIENLRKQQDDFISGKQDAETTKRNLSRF